MFGSKAAFRAARRAANVLGNGNGLANSSVRGGMYMQNCFVSTSCSASTATLSAAGPMPTGNAAPPPEALDLAESLSITDPVQLSFPFCLAFPRTASTLTIVHSESLS